MSKSDIETNAPQHEEATLEVPISSFPLERTSAAAVRRLADDLKKLFAFDEGAAVTIATAISPTPGSTEARLGAPTKLRTSHGDILVLDVYLLAGMITPHLANARYADKFARPANAWSSPSAEDTRPNTYPVITRLYSPKNGQAPMLHIDVVAKEQVLGQLARQRALLGFQASRRGNEASLVESVAKQGNTEPIFVFATRLKMQKGKAATILSAGDGARRATAAHEELRILTERDPYAGTLHWQDSITELDEKASANARAHLSFKGIAGSSAVSELWQAKNETRDAYLARLTSDQKAIHRCRTLHARLVVGFVAAYPSADLAMAVEEYISRQHMPGSMPQQWSEDGQYTKAYWVAVEALLDADLLSNDELALLLGNIDKSNASQMGIEHADQAFARILAIVAHNKVRFTRAIHRALKMRGIDLPLPTLLAKRVAIAVQGALSYFPVSDEGRARQQVVKALTSGFDDDAYSRVVGWAERITDDVTALAAEATADVERFAAHVTGTKSHHPSPAGVALMALALPHLATVPGPDRRLTSTGRGGRGNVTKADPDQILLNMLRTIGGVRQLAEVIRAGRLGKPAGRVTPDGNVVAPQKEENGADAIADDQWVRSQWGATLRVATGLAQTPDEQLRAAVQNAYAEAVRWAASVDDLFKFVDDAGAPLLRVVRFDRKDYRDMRAFLNDACDRLAPVLSDDGVSS